MKETIRYAVVGAGGVGGYFGAKLAQSGCPTQFLLHSDYDHVRQHGFAVHSTDGDFTLPGDLFFRRVADMEPVDAVIVGLKTVRNRELLPSLVKPLLRPRGIVLLIQNGIGVEEDAAELLPGMGIVGGLAFICSSKTQPGVVEHRHFGSINLAPYGKVKYWWPSRVIDGKQVARGPSRIIDVFSGYPNEDDLSDCDATTPLVSKEVFRYLERDLREAGVPTHVVEHREARWKKAVWNMPFNGLCVTRHCLTDALVGQPDNRRLVRDMMLEVIGAAHARGVTGVGEEFADKMLAMTDEMPPYAPSMRLDYDYGRPLELEYIYERPLALAREAGFDMPLCAKLLDELKAMTGK